MLTSAPLLSVLVVVLCTTDDDDLTVMVMEMELATDTCITNGEHAGKLVDWNH